MLCAFSFTSFTYQTNNLLFLLFITLCFLCISKPSSAKNTFHKVDESIVTEGISSCLKGKREVLFSLIAEKKIFLYLSLCFSPYCTLINISLLCICFSLLLTCTYLLFLFFFFKNGSLSSPSSKSKSQSTSK